MGVTTMKFLLFLALFDALSCQMSIKINGDTYACTLEAKGSEVPPMKIEISNAALKTSAKPEGDENIEKDGENNEDVEEKPTEKDGEKDEDPETKPTEEDGEKDEDPEEKINRK